MLCRGEERVGLVGLTETWGPFQYRFASEANRQSFLAEPNRWSIQWNGGCGRMGPLSGRGSPDRWLLHKERIYIFSSEECRSSFEGAPVDYVIEAIPRPEPTPASLASGKAWLERVVEAHGAKALDPAKLLHGTRVDRDAGWERREELWISPTELRRRWQSIPDDADAGEALTTDWYLGENSFERTKDGLVPLVGPDIQKDLMRYAHRALLPLLWARSDPDFVVAEAPLEDSVAGEVVRLSIFYRGLETHLDVDTETARVTALSWRGRLGDGLTRDILERFTGWSEVDGALLPTGRDVLIGGERNEAHSTKEEIWTLLPESPPNIFDPAG